MRKTEYSAGYDLVAAEDIVIPSYYNMMEETLERLTVEKLPKTNIYLWKIWQN